MFGANQRAGVAEPYATEQASKPHVLVYDVSPTGRTKARAALDQVGCHVTFAETWAGAVVGAERCKLHPRLESALRFFTTSTTQTEIL